VGTSTDPAVISLSKRPRDFQTLIDLIVSIVVQILHRSMIFLENRGPLFRIML